MANSPYYIYCDGYDNKPIKRKKNVIVLNSDHKDISKNTININLAEIEQILIKSKNTLGHDLIRIAAYVYGADCRISRGTYKDVYEESWTRNLNFFIPVLEPDFWNNEETKEVLTSILDTI